MTRSSTISLAFSTGGPYTDRLRWDYRIRNLMGAEPHGWNMVPATQSSQAGSGQN
ncbi:MAG: hypothetical protein HY646_02930 [Acidobacteria bacterium]|nr:hypothetical protein [Acidobacteriota bacterium]